MSGQYRGETLTWRDYETQTNLHLFKMKRIDVAVDPASIAANASAETAVTILGLQVGDFVVANVPASLETGLAFSGCRVSAADTLQLRLTNATGSGVDGASRTWQFLVFDLTQN